jgi:hypothetical protein
VQEVPGSIPGAPTGRLQDFGVFSLLRPGFPHKGDFTFPAPRLEDSKTLESFLH